MGIKYEVVPALWEHGLEVAANMRHVDRDEVWAAGHYTPGEAVCKSLLGSRDTKFAGLADGETVCVFGIASHGIKGVGNPWLLGTPALSRHARAFLRLNKPWLAEQKQHYDWLYNWVDARNLTSIRWLRWLGFVIMEASPFGPDRMLFHPFQMEINRVDNQASQPAA